jgi:hypothetical protein
MFVAFSYTCVGFSDSIILMPMGSRIKLSGLHDDSLSKRDFARAIACRLFDLMWQTISLEYCKRCASQF